MQSLGPRPGAPYRTPPPPRPPPLPNFGPSPEIDFFDVSDDLEQKKNFLFLVQKIFWTFFGTKKFLEFFLVQKNFGPETAPQG